MPRRSRVRAGELLINRWRLPTWWVLILPLLVILKRFLAPDLVFILDILLFLKLGGWVKARPQAFGAATACPAGPPKSRAFYKAQLLGASLKWIFRWIGRALAVAGRRGGRFAGNPKILGFAAAFGNLE